MLALMPKKSEKPTKVIRIYAEYAQWISKIAEVQEDNTADVIATILDTEKLKWQYVQALEKAQAKNAALIAEAAAKSKKKAT